MRQKDFEKLVKRIKQAGAIKKGEMAPSRRFEFDPIDIRAIREKLKQSQWEFALMIGVSVSTLQNWEQGRRKPEDIHACLEYAIALVASEDIDLTPEPA